MRHNDNDFVWDTVIIGAGIAGLTASIYLARAGQKVLLLEKGAHPGGRAASTELADAQVNLGAHALNRSALPILRDIGVIPDGMAPKPPGSLVFDGENSRGMNVSLLRLLFGSRLNSREKYQLLGFYWSLNREDASSLNRVSLQEYLDTRVPSLCAQRIVLALVRLSTYCDAPDLISAGAVIHQLKQSRVLYVNGGWQSLINQLTTRAQQAGVSIRNGVSVQEVRGTMPRIEIKLKDESRLISRNIISTAGPKSTLAFLNPALTTTEEALYRQLVPVYAACLDLVVTGMPNPQTTFVLGADAPWYYANHSATASLSIHSERNVVHVMKYLPATGHSDPKRDEYELTGFLDCIQSGWRKHVVRKRLLPRMLVTHAVPTAETGGLQGRPGPQVKGRPGIYVAGDWVGSEGMLVHASLASAREAARMILTDTDIYTEGAQDGT
ncbi:phytoene desaturase family protein [Paenibacillus xylanilyticus]|uniref:phytoene desaturase family protein n=1 Tax=Paenibacillus xylanilyticus TaxID=248903 RepID=UPI003AAEA63C